MTPLWHVLENYESEILRTEMLNGDETYLVNVKVSRGGLLKFWICPEKGFRLVKSQRRYECLKDNATIPMKKGTHYLLERILLYREYQPGIWYPEKIIETFHALVAKDPENRAEHLGNTTLQISDAFQLNLDVSNEFQLDVPPETLIYDGVLEKLRPFRELTETSQ